MAFCNMNDFEQHLVDKVLAAVHDIEVKLVKELGEMRGDISALSQKSASEHENLRAVVERSIAVDTERLNKHSREIDEHSGAIRELQEWKRQFEKTVANRIAISQSISAIVAVIIAFVLSHFIG